MGLDMYIYKASKPTGIRTDIVHDYAALQDRDFSLFEAENVEGEKWFADLIPYCVKVKCVAEYYDVPRIAKAYNLGENAHWCGFGPDGIYFIGDNKEVAVPDEEVKKFCIKKEKEWYVVHIEEVAYWRKHYTLQDWFYENLGYVENCGYHILNADLIAEMNAEFDEDVAEEDPTDNEALFYHEWY